MSQCQKKASSGLYGASITRGRHIDSPGGCHSIRPNQQSTSINPSFLCRMPFLPQPSQFILAWDRHRNMLDCIPRGLVPRLSLQQIFQQSQNRLHLTPDQNSTQVYFIQFSLHHTPCMHTWHASFSTDIVFPKPTVERKTKQQDYRETKARKTKTVI